MHFGFLLFLTNHNWSMIPVRSRCFALFFFSSFFICSSGHSIRWLVAVVVLLKSGFSLCFSLHFIVGFFIRIVHNVMGKCARNGPVNLYNLLFLALVVALLSLSLPLSLFFHHLTFSHLVQRFYFLSAQHSCNLITNLFAQN